MRIEIVRQHTTIRANPGPQKFETRRKIPPSQALESPGSLPEGGRLSGEGSLTKGLHASAGPSERAVRAQIVFFLF